MSLGEPRRNRFPSVLLKPLGPLFFNPPEWHGQAVWLGEIWKLTKGRNVWIAEVAATELRRLTSHSVGQAWSGGLSRWPVGRVPGVSGGYMAARSFRRYDEAHPRGSVGRGICLVPRWSPNRLPRPTKRRLGYLDDGAQAMNGVVFTAAALGQLDTPAACPDHSVTFHRDRFASRSGLS